jgi:hypothetical protein
MQLVGTRARVRREVTPVGLGRLILATEGRFDSGIRRLQPERPVWATGVVGPLLVPVAVANFDKLTTTTTAAVVHEPFRLSDFLPDPGDERALLEFINHRVGPSFRDWVREAAALAGRAG